MSGIFHSFKKGEGELAIPFNEIAVKTLSLYCSLVPGFISISSEGSSGGPSENTALFDRPKAGTLAPSGLFLASWKEKQIKHGCCNE